MPAIVRLVQRRPFGTAPPFVHVDEAIGPDKQGTMMADAVPGDYDIPVPPGGGVRLGDQGELATPSGDLPPKAVYPTRSNDDALDHHRSTHSERCGPIRYNQDKHAFERFDIKSTCSAHVITVPALERVIEQGAIPDTPASDPLQDERDKLLE